MAWRAPRAIDTWARVFDFGSGTDVNMFLTTSAGSAPRFSITTNGGANEQRLDGTAPLPANRWTHLAVTLSGTTGTLYVNGSAVATKADMTLSPSSLGSTTSNWIGTSQYPADPLLDGAVDEVHISSRALGADEVRSLTTTPGGGHVAAYHFDEASGDTAADASGHGRDAMLVAETLGDPLYQVVTRRGRQVIVTAVNARPRALRAQVDLGGWSSPGAAP